MVRSILDIGGKSVDRLEADVKRVRNIGGYASDVVHNPKFTTLEKVTPIEIIKLPVSALGLDGTPTTKQVLGRIPQCRVGDMALELCPVEVGLHLAIKDTEQPLSDCYYIMHEPIPDRHGSPLVFGLERDARGLWLSVSWARPDRRWLPEYQLVCALRRLQYCV